MALFSLKGEKPFISFYFFYHIRNWNVIWRTYFPKAETNKNKMESTHKHEMHTREYNCEFDGYICILCIDNMLNSIDGQWYEILCYSSNFSKMYNFVTVRFIHLFLDVLTKSKSKLLTTRYGMCMQPQMFFLFIDYLNCLKLFGSIINLSFVCVFFSFVYNRNRLKTREKMNSKKVDWERNGRKTMRKMTGRTNLD